MKLKLLVVAIPWAVCIAWATYFFSFSSKQYLTAEHHELINRFRERRYTDLREIDPKPRRVVDASEMVRPHLNARYYLHFLIVTGEVHALVICVDENLGLIDYYVRKED